MPLKAAYHNRNLTNDCYQTSTKSATMTTSDDSDRKRQIRYNQGSALLAMYHTAMSRSLKERWLFS
eukprot:1356454-Amphidinium_carterae.1